MKRGRRCRAITISMPSPYRFDPYRETAAERCGRQQHETRLAGSRWQRAPTSFSLELPDLQKAASATAAGIFYNQGQVCIAGTRLLLEESIADGLALLKQQAQTRQPGHPLNPATTMGTLIDCAHADSVHSFIREGESERATVCWMAVTPGWLPPSARPSLWI